MNFKHEALRDCLKNIVYSVPPHRSPTVENIFSDWAAQHSQRYAQYKPEAQASGPKSHRFLTRLRVGLVSASKRCYPTTTAPLAKQLNCHSFQNN
jgi:hypothetical protein